MATSISCILNDIFNDPSFTKHESEILKSFAVAAKSMLASGADVTNSVVWNISSISQKADVLTTRFGKESPLMIGLWVVFVALTKSSYPESCRFKYPNVEAFLTEYGGRFDDFDVVAQEQLKDEANWFNVIFELLPARKNKGLCIAVIPRVIEGWKGGRYVTGSGQTKATADRVYIFENEGDVQPCHRGGVGGGNRKKKSPRKKTNKLLNFAKTPVASRPPAAGAMLEGGGASADTSAAAARIHLKRMEQKRLSSSLARAERIVTRRGSKEFSNAPFSHATAPFSDATPPAAAPTESETYPFPKDLYDNTDVEFDDVSVVSDHEVFMADDPQTATTVCSSSSSASASASASAASSFPMPASPTRRLLGNISSLGGGLGGGLGGSSFQPLFDFGFSFDRSSRAGCVAPPYLKRAFSWEHYCPPEAPPKDTGEGMPHLNDKDPFDKGAPFDENQANGGFPFPQMPLAAERATSKASVTDFLFDEFLAATAADSSDSHPHLHSVDQP
jgi:hypothetical protein